MSRHIIRSSGIVGGFTLISRALGLARDVLMAGLFGTSVWMSAFVVAFTIPNLFRRLFGEGALASSFVPIFVETRRREGDEAAWNMAHKVASLLMLVLLAIVVVGELGVAGYLGVHEPSEKVASILKLLQIMLPYLFFICLAALSMAILNSFRHFAVPAATPCLLNICWILAVLFVCPFMPDNEQRIRVVAWAVLIAGLLQLSGQLPILARFGYRPRWSPDPRDERVRRMLRLMGPAALGLAVTQFNVLIDRLLATWIGTWAPAALFFSERMIYFPLGIIATAMGTVLLPTFSAHAADRNDRAYLVSINHSLRMMLFIMVPAAVGLLILATPIIRMIFEWKAFNAQSTHLTAIALQFYAPGLIVFSLTKIFVPAFYAQKDTRTPVLIGLGAVGLNLALNLVFVMTWPLYLKHAGLAFATVLAEAAYVGTLAVILSRRYGSPGWSGIAVSAGKILICAIGMGLVVYALRMPVTQWMTAHFSQVKTGQIMAVAIMIALGGATYILLAALLRTSEIRELAGALAKR